MWISLKIVHSLPFDYEAELKNLEERSIDFMRENLSKGFFVQFHSNIEIKRLFKNNYDSGFKEYKRTVGRIIEKRITTQAKNVMAFYYGIIYRAKYFDKAHYDNYYNDDRMKGEKYILMDRIVFDKLVGLKRLPETVLVVAFPTSFVYCNMKNLWDKCVIDVNDKKKLANLKLGMSVIVNKRDVCLIHESMFISDDPHHAW